jgi:CBS domain-containing protein
MKVRDLMTSDVKHCGVHDSLNRAAQIMWENNCGCVPVVDEQGHVVGILTDRDICMAAYTQGVTLSGSSVASAMAREVHTCEPGETVTAALKKMKTHRVRRLPVIDENQRLVGIISLNDIAREGEREREAKLRKRAVKDSEIAQTLGAICTHNGSAMTTRAA